MKKLIIIEAELKKKALLVKKAFNSFDLELMGTSFQKNFKGI